MTFDTALSAVLRAGTFTDDSASLSHVRVRDGFGLDRGVVTSGIVDDSSFLDTFSRVYGMSLDPSEIGFVASSDGVWQTVGVIPSGFPIDATVLVDRWNTLIDEVEFVGHGTLIEPRLIGFVDALHSSMTHAVQVTRAVVIEDDQCRSVLSGERSTVESAIREAVRAYPLGVQSDEDVFSRLLPRGEGERVSREQQQRVGDLFREGLGSRPVLERAGFSLGIVNDLVTSVDPDRDTAAIAALTELLQDSEVLDIVTAQAIGKKALSDGLVRAARGAIADHYATPVWVAAATSIWVHGGDEFGPIPTHIVAHAIEPRIEHSVDARHLHNHLMYGHDAEVIEYVAHTGVVFEDPRTVIPENRTSTTIDWSAPGSHQDVKWTR